MPTHDSCGAESSIHVSWTEKNLLSYKIISVTDRVSAAFTKLPIYTRKDTPLFFVNDSIREFSTLKC